MQGIVFDIQRFSIHDGPGIRTTVFLKGCRLRCQWCQNPEGLGTQSELVWWGGKCIRCGKCIPACPEGALSLGADGIAINRRACVLCGACVDVCPEEALTIVGREMSVAEVAGLVERDRIFYETSGGGVTLSGGDPTVQAEFSGALLKECRARGINTAVETGMFCDWQALELMLPHTDLFLLDLKIMDPVDHRRFTGQDNTLIKQNFERLCREGVRRIARIALIPDITATESNVRAIAQYVLSVDRTVPIELLNFNPLCKSKYEKLGREYPLSSVKMISDEQMDSFRRIVRDTGCRLYGEQA